MPLIWLSNSAARSNMLFRNRTTKSCARGGVIRCGGDVARKHHTTPYRGALQRLRLQHMLGCVALLPATHAHIHIRIRHAVSGSNTPTMHGCRAVATHLSAAFNLSSCSGVRPISRHRVRQMPPESPLPPSERSKKWSPWPIKYSINRVCGGSKSRCSWSK